MIALVTYYLNVIVPVLKMQNQTEQVPVNI